MNHRPFDIGFIGGGQLARMSIQAAQRMGLLCLWMDPQPDGPASYLAPGFASLLHDPEGIANLLRQCERVTLENEFVPASSLRQALHLAGRAEEAVLPGVDCLETIQDKLVQRRAYERAGVPSPSAVPLGEQGPPGWGWPMVLKARFGGYDGKGTRIVASLKEFESYRSLWEREPWMAEQYVPFERELAVMVWRDSRGVGAFPTMQTVQVNHICDQVFPCQADATEVAYAAVEAVGGYGLFGVELFQTPDGEILVNEIAPRPHNSGHYTLDWGGVSQFDQHVRMACELPALEAQGNPTCMVNLLGYSGAHDFREGLKSALATEPEARVYWYGKRESREGRKMGHINVSGTQCRERALCARESFLKAYRP